MRTYAFVFGGLLGMVLMATCGCSDAQMDEMFGFSDEVSFGQKSSSISSWDADKNGIWDIFEGKTGQEEEPKTFGGVAQPSSPKLDFEPYSQENFGPRPATRVDTAIIANFNQGNRQFDVPKDASPSKPKEVAAGQGKPAPAGTAVEKKTVAAPSGSNSAGGSKGTDTMAWDEDWNVDWGMQ